MMDPKKKEIQFHLFVSNQSAAIPLSDLETSIDGWQIFHREMKTGTQHNWEQLAIQVPAGKVKLDIHEKKTRTQRPEIVSVDRELWIVIAFHGPPAQLRVDVFDRPVAFM